MAVGVAGIGATAFSAGLTFFAAIAAFAAAVIVLYWALPVLRDARATLNEHLPSTRRRLSVPFIVIVSILFAFAVLASLFVLVHTMMLVWHGSTDGINLGSGTLIAALLGAPFLIWGTWLKYQTVRYQKEGHITDRINKAVEQLGAEKTVKRREFKPKLKTAKDGKAILENGNPVPDVRSDGLPLGDWLSVEETVPNIEVRIGAILSLERIAQDSTIYDKGRDHVRVMEILCAYVRENSRAQNLTPTPTPFMTKKPRLDVQKAIDVIKRRTSEQVAVESLVRYRLDLRETDLDGCDLSKGHFAGAVFWQSRLEAADLRFSDFTGARMEGCLLDHAKFFDAVLRGTNLNFCILSVRGNLGITLAKLDSIFVEGGNIEGLHISKRNAKAVFGSSDTKVAWGQEEHKKRGLAAADRIYMDEMLEEGDHLASHGHKIEEAEENFLHWNPYDSNDFASGQFREKFRKEKNLIGWPFED